MGSVLLPWLCCYIAVALITALSVFVSSLKFTIMCPFPLCQSGATGRDTASLSPSCLFMLVLPEAGASSEWKTAMLKGRRPCALKPHGIFVIWLINPQNFQSVWRWPISYIKKCIIIYLTLQHARNLLWIYVDAKVLFCFAPGCLCMYHAMCS